MEELAECCGVVVWRVGGWAAGRVRSGWVVGDPSE